MNHSDGRIEELHENRIQSLTLPVLLGAAVGLVSYLALAAVVLLVILSTFDYSRSFETGDAVGAALACGFCLVLTGALAPGSPSDAPSSGTSHRPWWAEPAS